MTAEVLKIVEKKKACSKCKVEKLYSEFHKSSYFNDGLKSECKDCKHAQYKNSRTHSEDLRKNVILTKDGRGCVMCKQEKPWADFIKDVHGYNEKTASCRVCRAQKARKYYKDNPDKRFSCYKSKPSRVLRTYGVTYQHIIHVLASQFGCCANRACGKEISLDVSGPVKNRAVIDHDHSTGKFRALLCTPCNTALGMIESRQNILIGLMEYKEKFK